MSNPWSELLENLRHEVAEEDFRRWFSATAYASDSGDHLTVWVPAVGIRRMLETHYYDTIVRTLARMGRPHTTVRFVVAGYDEDEDGGA
jgi:chromosomal replication initiation ATPase DnaA